MPSPLIETIAFVSGNPNKLIEVRGIMGDAVSARQLPFELPEIQSTDPRHVIVAKIETARRHVRGPLVIDDTSLFLLDWGKGDLPGPFIKFFVQNGGPNEICRLAQTFGDRARAVTVLGFFDPRAGTTTYFEGAVDGRITSAPRGTGGFDWDSVFEVGGRTFAELTPEEKNAHSMRSRAFLKLRQHLAHRHNVRPSADEIDLSAANLPSANVA